MEKSGCEVMRLRLCTDLWVLVEGEDKVFVCSWIFLVSHGLWYAAIFRETARK